MAYSGIDNGIKQERNTHFHDLLHAQLSAEDTRNTDNNDSADDSGESPLDFSIKRKSRSFEEVSGSDSLSSPASSLNDTGGHLEDRKVDNESCSNAITNGPRQSSPNGYQHTYRDKQYNQEQLQQRLSPVQERIGQPQLADNENGSSGHGLPNMLNELQMGLANANMLNNSFPAMAALMDHRRLTNSYKGTRPFKAYPKDALALSVANIGIPQYMTSFANFENSAMVQGLNLTSEEVFSIYKQQLLALRERDKYLEALKMSQEASSTRTSTATSSSPTTTLPSTLTSMHHLSSLPPSISSMHFSNKNNGINNNMLGNIPPSRSSSSEASSPQSHLQTNNNINCLTNTSSLTPGGRRRPRSLPDEQKDDSYWERRRKNNEAAKRSRDARRAKEDEIAIRAALLEQENLKLRVEVAALKTETAKLRCMLYNT